MQAITFNYPGSKIPETEESLCIRCCFLAAEFAVTAGTSYETICFEHYYTPKSTLEKVEMIAAYYQNKNGKEWEVKADQVRNMYELMKKVKHHSKEGIVRVKKFEHSLDKLFLDIKRELLEGLANTGLPQLRPLAKDGLLRVCPVRIDDPEFEGNDRVPASKILQLQFPPDEVNEPEIFCLGLHFFLGDYISPLKISLKHTDKNAASGKGFLQPCIRVPNLNLLSAKELSTVRTQVKEPADRFNRRMNEWIMMTRKNLPADETHAYFEDYILPSAGVLDTLLKENEILKHCSRLQNDRVSVLIFIGELPWQVILDYYKFNDIISETTFNKVMEAKEQNPKLKGRIPVMILGAGTEGVPAILKNPLPAAESEKVLPSKKSISID